MNKLHALPLALAILFAPLTPQAVADKCKGEASFAVAECSCAVQNRRLIGWRDDLVLSAFYATPSRATLDEVATTAAILDGTTQCSSSLYFMWSYQDTVMLGIDHLEPVLTVKRGGQEVRFFERLYKKRK